MTAFRSAQTQAPTSVQLETRLEVLMPRVVLITSHIVLAFNWRII